MNIYSSFFERKKPLPLLALFISLASQRVEAHPYSEITLPKEGLTLDLSASLSYRSESLVSSNEVWVIPGTLMGGEAYPTRKGLSVDEVFLVPSFRQGKAYGFLKMGRHIGSDEFEFDHALIGYQPMDHVAIEFGEMAGIFSPFNGQHVLDTAFSGRRLVYDAFWGGQHSDQGVRLKTNFKNIDAGIELWKGESFPAKQSDTDKSAFDIYARYTHNHDPLFLQVGVFHYAADALKREDSRYAAGHSHGSSITLDPTYFDGDVKVQGLSLVSTVKLNETWALGFQGEVSQMKQDGRLWDLTHASQFENKSTGLWGELSVSWQNEELAFRSERLKIQNDITGSAALVLADKLQLTGSDTDPYRHAVSYGHRFADGLRSRIEWSKDFSTTAKKEIVTIGLVWAGTLWESPKVSSDEG